MDQVLKNPAKNRSGSNMTMIVEGHKVALYFADQPNVQVALKIKQALLGPLLAAGK